MRILVSGFTGKLGSHLQEAAADFPGAILGLTRSPAPHHDRKTIFSADLADLTTLTTAFHQAQPDVFLHLGVANSSGASTTHQSAATLTINTAATAHLAELAQRAQVRFILASTDVVFAGNDAPYAESAAPDPINLYGKMKAACEQEVQSRGGIVARLPLQYGHAPGTTARSFYNVLWDSLKNGDPVNLFVDEFRTPAYLGDTARALLTLAHDAAPPKILHLGGPEELSRYEFGLLVAQKLGAPAALLQQTHASAFPEPRPGNVSLCSDLWNKLHPECRFRSLSEVLETDEQREGSVG